MSAIHLGIQGTGKVILVFYLYCVVLETLFLLLLLLYFLLLLLVSRNRDYSVSLAQPSMLHVTAETPCSLVALLYKKVQIMDNVQNSIIFTCHPHRHIDLMHDVCFPCKKIV
jgi:hypothetical protein